MAPFLEETRQLVGRESITMDSVPPSPASPPRHMLLPVPPVVFHVLHSSTSPGPLYLAAFPRCLSSALRRW